MKHSKFVKFLGDINNTNEENIRIESLLMKAEMTQPLKIMSMDHYNGKEKNLLFDGPLLDLMASKDKALLKRYLYRLRVDHDTIVIYV